MPELPEVETIRLGLQKYLVGHKIKNIEVRLQRIITGDYKNILDSKIIKIDRFGKGLVIELDNDYLIAIHVKMTGQLIYQGKNLKKVLQPSLKLRGILPNKYTHVIFFLDTKSMLFYNDVRQFGWIKIIKKDELLQLPFFKELGPEPLKGLSLVLFKSIVSSSKMSIKPLLMDQKRIGGIGNIYANDSLWLAKIKPDRKANTLSENEITELFNAIESVLRKSLQYGGASEVNFVNAIGEEGGYQHHFLIYGKNGSICQRCGTKIEKTFLAGRGTFFCPTCQK